MFIVNVAIACSSVAQAQTKDFSFLIFFQKIALALTHPVFMAIRSLLSTGTDPKEKEKGLSGL